MSYKDDKQCGLVYIETIKDNNTEEKTDFLWAIESWTEVFVIPESDISKIKPLEVVPMYELLRSRCFGVDEKGVYDDSFYANSYENYLKKEDKTFFDKRYDFKSFNYQFATEKIVSIWMDYINQIIK